MNKFALIALALTIGVTCAFAATMKVPWFVDNAPVNTGLPPVSGGTDGFFATTTLVYLSNTTGHQLDCTIGYYSSNGTAIGPFTNNTFKIDANATVAFRPVASDLLDVNDPNHQNGQESAAGNAIPNRPRDPGDNSVFSPAQIAADPTINQKNGSIVITYSGRAADLGGSVITYSQGAQRSSAISFGHALIPLFGSI